MKGFLHKLFQVSATVAQVGNVLLPVLTEDNKVLFGACLGVAQAIAGFRALYTNPDGTPATIAYQPEKFK